MGSVPILDDPTIALISYYDLFSFPIDRWAGLSPSLFYVNNHHDEHLIPSSTPPSEEIIFCDENVYNTLSEVKKKYDHSYFLGARNACNPFEKLSNSAFMNRAAIKIANIDSVVKLPKVDTFCDIAAGPGGFTQYIQYRYPSSYGYGMTLKTPKDDWNIDLLNTKRFEAIYGPNKDDNGDLYAHWKFFVDYVKKKHPEGVNLVTADGGFQTEFESQEEATSRLLLVQSLIGILCCKKGGAFVLKVFDTVTLFSAHLIYVLSTFFREIIMFKPMSSRPANSERYLICKDRNENVDVSTLIDKSMMERPLSLFSNELPESFDSWLSERNNVSLVRQLAVGRCIIDRLYPEDKKILLSLGIDEMDDVLLRWIHRKYDLDKALLIWNLPMVRDERSKIKVN